MTHFLQSKDNSWKISEAAILDSLENIDWRYLAVEKKIDDLVQKYSRKEIQEPFFSNQLISFLEEKVKLQGIDNRTSTELLNDTELLNFWTQSQKTIDESYTILSDLISQRVPGAQVEKINLPVLWNKKGQALIANPVNSLHVNGNLYYSAPIAELFTKSIDISDPKHPKLKRVFHRYGRYEQLIKEKLESVGF